MKKKMLSVLLSAATAVSLLAGCGKSPDAGGNSQVSSTAASDSTRQSDTAAEGTASGAPVKFDLSMHVANVEGQEPAIYAICQAYMKAHPNVSINITGEETTEHYNKMKMEAQAGTLPDVFFNLIASDKEMASQGLLYNLDDFVTQNNLSSVMNSNMVNALEVDGHVYGLPYQALVTGFWYNKDLFEQYGLKFPSTYEELVKCTKVFAENGIVTIAQGAQDPYSVWAMMAELCHFGYFDRIDNILMGEESFNNDDFRKFYTDLDELRGLGAFPDNVSTSTYYDAKEMFCSGKAAMFDSGSWEAKYLEENMSNPKAIGFSWGVSFENGVGNQEIASNYAHAPLAISAKVAEDPDKLAAILDFFKFYYSDEGAKVMIDNLVTPPTNYSGTIGDDFVSQHPAFASVLEQINLGYEGIRTQADNVSTEAFGNALYDSIYGVINGVYKPDEAMNAVQAAVDDDLGK